MEGSPSLLTEDHERERECQEVRHAGCRLNLLGLSIRKRPHPGPSLFATGRYRLFNDLNHTANGCAYHSTNGPGGTFTVTGAAFDAARHALMATEQVAASTAAVAKVFKR